MAQSNPMQSISLTLTRDELLATLQLLGSASMNGLPEDPWAGVSEKERAERLNAGLETLINRGFVEARSADSLVLDDTLIALVGSCVIPDVSLLLNALQVDGTGDPRFFNATKEILVQHTMPRLGVHEFSYLPDQATLSARIQVVLAALTTVTTADGFTLQTSDKVIGEIFQLARAKNQTQAIKALTAAQWPKDQAEAFVLSSADHPIYTGICAWGLRRGEPEGSQTLIAVANEQRCWLLEPADTRGELLHIRAVTGAECLLAYTRMADRLISAAGVS